MVDQKLPPFDSGNDKNQDNKGETIFEREEQHQESITKEMTRQPKSMEKQRKVGSNPPLALQGQIKPKSQLEDKTHCLEDRLAELATG